MGQEAERVEAAGEASRGRASKATPAGRGVCVGEVVRLGVGGRRFHYSISG